MNGGRGEGDTESATVTDKDREQRRLECAILAEVARESVIPRRQLLEGLIEGQDSPARRELVTRSFKQLASLGLLELVGRSVVANRATRRVAQLIEAKAS